MMTREEAIEYFESLLKRFKEMHETETSYWGKAHAETAIAAMCLALAALRPVSREQVEKVWRGEWVIQQDEHKEYIKRCSKCGFPISGWWGADKFCANCGAPMTDEAVQMVMERLGALHE